jgi:hypothetical protein
MTAVDSDTFTDSFAKILGENAGLSLRKTAYSQM